MTNVLWIAGAAGAGKTTVARLLARSHGLRWHNSDAQTWQHLDRAVAAGIPNARRFAAMTPAQRAAAAPEEIEYDRGPFTVDDLRGLPAAPLIVVDGAPPVAVEGAVVDGAPPVAVESAVVGGAAGDAGRVVWLLPSRAVQRARLERRHPDGIPARYLRLWQSAADRAAASGDPVVTVDDLTVEETLAEVERLFAGRLAEGPLARTVAGRREVLRHSNLAIVGQCRGWLAHQPDPRARVAAQRFDCECGRPGCLALVELPVEAAESAVAAGLPGILAPGHA